MSENHPQIAPPAKRRTPLLVGIAALALGVAVFWVPELAPGLHGSSQMMGMAGS